MDSKVVNQSIKANVWPVLRTAGFGVFSPRTAWRHHADRIDVVNVQSFNSHTATVIGCTTYSFSINLGCFHLAVPPEHAPAQVKRKNNLLFPHEYECQFRGQLSRSFAQQELERRDIWHIDSSGNSLLRAIDDVCNALSLDGLSWFEKFSSLESVLDILENQDEQMNTLWGFGRNPSPIRNYLVGYVALALGRTDVARNRLRQALESGCFKRYEEQLRVYGIAPN